MSRIIDITTTDDEVELLTSTETTGGLLGGGEILATNPLETYLYENEDPKYILRNKKAGLSIEGNGTTEEITPDEAYQTVGLVTDLRIIFVAGQEDGDEKVELPLTQIIEAKAQSEGFRTSSLTVSTVANEVWRFACTDDVSSVARHVDELAQIWANSQRLLDEVETQVSGAEEALHDRDIEQARGKLGDAETKIQTAVERSTEAGPAARMHIESRARTVADWLLEVKRMLTADEAAQAHASAQQEWGLKRYEAAAKEYERAIETYRTALATVGPKPTDNSLHRRLNGAIKERELLRIGPLVDADAARRRAIEKEDPEKAASAWERALDGYRELLSLNWGKDTREFVVNKDDIRKQTIAIADDAIEDHIVAGRQWVHSADRLAVDGHDKQATEVYERAQKQFELAEQLAREVRPEQLDSIDEALELINSRLSGATPEAVPETSPLETVVLTGTDGETQPVDSQTEQGKEAPHGEDPHHFAVEEPRVSADTDTREKANSRSAGETVPPEETATAPTENQQPDTTVSSSTERSTAEDDSEGGAHEKSVLDQIQESKQKGGVETGRKTEWQRRATRQSGDKPEHQAHGFEQQGNKPGHEEHKSEHQEDRTGQSGNTAEQREDQPEATHPRRSTAERRTEKRRKEPVVRADEADTESDIEANLRSLSDSAFDTLIAELWEVQGWSTTIFSVVASSAFDIVAFREQPTEERLGIWTVHEPDDAVDTTDVTDCITAREASRGADAAAILTTATVTTAGRARAEEHDIAVVDTTELVQLIRFEELTERLTELASE